MSWIAGFWGDGFSPAWEARLAAVHPAALHRRVAAEGGYVAAGGLAETCRAGVLPGAEGGGWLVVGSGLVRAGAGVRLLDDDAWAARLAPDAPDFEGLDGHFVAVRWRGGTFSAFTDALGVRSFYLAKVDGGLVFSTRLDWLCRLAGRHEVDFAALGSHWLASNQFAARSLVEGVVRLGPGGSAVCARGVVDVREAAWEPGRPPEAPPDPIGQLERLLHPALDAGAALSLGLSGGLDSRLLLALLVRGETPYRLHVFGPDADPDVRVSRQIAAGLGLLQVHLAAAVPPPGEALRLLAGYAGQTCASTPASAVARLSDYGALHAGRRVVVDGGFGEVARRQYFNRLLRRGDLARARPEALVPHVRVHRADVFGAEAMATMRRGLADELAGLFETMPPVADVGAEGFVDLLAIRTRLPHFFGYGQPRLDEEVVNYMPFAQPSFLRDVLHTPVRLRAEGRLFRRAIRARAPALAAYPLVKGGTTYPFALTTVPAWLWTKAKARLGAPYRNPTTRAFLDALADPVRDLAHSEAVRSYPAYDAARVRALVDGYYAGDAALAPQVDWWLAFEAWRRALAGLPLS